jgi:hypothetical protein
VVDPLSGVDDTMRALRTALVGCEALGLVSVHVHR